LGNDIRLIRIVIRGRIIPVGIVVGVPNVSAEVDAGSSVEMASAIISTMPAIIPTISSVATIISTMPT